MTAAVAPAPTPGEAKPRRASVLMKPDGGDIVSEYLWLVVPFLCFNMASDPKPKQTL